MWVSMNTRMQTSTAGTKAIKGTQGSIPLGDINHPRTPGSDGVRPSGTLSFSVYVAELKQSAATIEMIAIGTPKSPNALRI